MAYRSNGCHFRHLPGHFIRKCPFRFQPNGAEMAARIRENGSGGYNSRGGQGLLQTPTQSSGTSNAIVPYQAPLDRGQTGNGGNYQRGGNTYYRRRNYADEQRYSKSWSGGYEDWDRERERDEKLDRMYGLLSEQVEERERRKHESVKLELLEEEKKKLQAEEERRIQANKEREQQEARLGKIVRTSVKAVCESALGRKVDIPEDDDCEVAKLRKELEELRAKSSEASSSSRENDHRLEALRKEKEALLKARHQESEEERLVKEIAELRSRNEQHTHDNGKHDEILALQLQIKEPSGFRATLEEKNAEVSMLKSENQHLKRDVAGLRGDFLALRGKRGSGVITQNSPPEEPAKGKARADPSTTAIYTPKDLSALHKAYKEALAGKEMALKEAQMLKDRMARMGASRIRLSARRQSAKKTTPRNLRTCFQEMEEIPDDDVADKTQGEERRLEREGTTAARDLEVAKLAAFRDIRLRELRQVKKSDMEEACANEGITYVKLDQARGDIAEIRASRNYDAWLKEKDAADEED
ncbi:hypothetical protein CBR_g26397 [Chara braunii]|uniref:Uncharacterized protein n=1 Tax=Chara braunii TaxID=69332 RepID=A0A388L7V8_CHABU|nr:hypothetical protein CBR_g26397 [Chara braunii]|eukprot:GBG78368.1 hypothetical protein CBR_g26397 [Chara braunii]